MKWDKSRFVPTSNSFERRLWESMRKGKKAVGQLGYHFMMAPGFIFLIIFSFVPMFGILMAFQDYIPAKGIFRSAWVGLENFKYMFEIPDSMKILRNTVVIALGKIIFGTIVPIVFALLLNEIRLKWAKKRYKPSCTYQISYHGRLSLLS